MVTWRQLLYERTSRGKLHQLRQVLTPVRLLGTGKTQVVKRLIHTLIEEEYSVTVCAPLGLLATNYREEFYPDLQADTIHALFNIPIAADQQYVVNYNIGKYDAIIIDVGSCRLC